MITLAIGLLLVVLAATADHVPAPGACGGRAISRWSAAGGSYVANGSFGDRENEWLGSIAGVATTADGDVVVYDARQSRIHVLSESLRPKMQFGRRGTGPGELSGVGLPDLGERFQLRHRVAAVDSLFVIYDGAIKLYRRDGAFIRNDREVPRQGFVFGLRGVRASAGGYVFALDSLDYARGVRTLQTWEVIGRTARRLHALALSPPIARSQSGFMLGAQDARPVWDARGGCIVLGDGSSPRLLRIDQSTRKLDTLFLPKHDVAVQPLDIEAARAIQSYLAKRGKTGSIRDLTRVPSSLWRWAELLIDPDGHIWVHPWRPVDARGPYVVYRIDPSGVVHNETWPAFPIAFGPSGVFYARARAQSGELLLVRYEKRP